MANRSPNYPFLGLTSALEKAATLWASKGRGIFTPLEAVQDLNFSTLNGTSRSHLAALKQYGLLEDVDKDVRLSQLAIRIFAHPEGDPEREAAIREAALTPKLFRELLETYPEASDGTIKAYLITKKDFSEDGAKQVIKSLRDTIRLAKLDQPDYTPRSRGDEPEEKPPMSRQPSPPFTGHPSAEMHRVMASKTASDLHSLGVPVPEDRFTEYLNTRISDDCKVRILFDGKVTQEAIQKLKKYLDLIADDYPTKAELERAATPEDILPFPLEEEGVA